MELRHLRYFVAVAEELHFGHGGEDAPPLRRAQVDALRGGGIDVGFVGLPLEAEGLVTETTGRVRLVVALPAKHPMARSVPLP